MQRSAVALAIFILLAGKFELNSVIGYPHGAPASICNSMTPDHDGAEPQTSTSPYSLAVSSSNITSGNSLTITLSVNSDADKPHFIGFLIRGADVTAKDSTAYGTFTSFEHGLIDWVNCFDIVQSAITHDNNITKTEIIADWIAPYFNGQVQFLATVLYEYSTYWIIDGPNVDVWYDGTIPTTIPTTPTPPITGFEYDACGNTISCFGYPDKCIDTQSCLMIASYCLNEDGELSVNLRANTEGYVAFGLSTDTVMGSDSVIHCTSNYAGASVNIEYDNYAADNDDSYFTLEFIDNSAGTLSCSFSRPDQTTVTAANYGKVTTDLKNNEYYIFLAMGYTNSTGQGIVMHDAKLQTPISLNLLSTDYVIIDSDSRTPLNFDYSVCANTQSCFGYPSGCVTTKSCSAVMSYYPNGDQLDVSLMTSFDDYVAFGLSTDDQMGDDSVIECMGPSSPNGLVAASINVGTDNYLADGNMASYFTCLTASYQNKIISCEITRPLYTKVTSNGYYQETDISANQYYILLVGGPLKSDNTNIDHHTYTIQSSDAIDLMSSTFVIIGEKNKPSVYIVVHGALMVSAWICTVSIAIFMARYYKDMWPEAMWCKVKIWFAMHRALNVLTVVLTMAAFILIFVYKKGFSSIWKDNAHPIMGTITMAFAIIQPFGSLLRCAPGTPNRPFFNWCHRIMGFVTVIIALATIFLAATLPATYLDKRFWWVLCGYIGFYAVMFLTMDYYVLLQAKQLKETEAKSESRIHKKSGMFSFKSIMLCIFILGSVGFCSGLISLISMAKAPEEPVL